LRGCIGLIEAVKPLGETIQEMALSAAFCDPRFPPLTAQEFKDLDIEISVLTPLRRIKNVEEIQVGVHGLYLRNGSCRGLLLPQVATQYNWDRDTFLQQTCCKACLPPMAWKDPQTEIYVFSADIF
jgi:AmmeMemoRadiSam system protein A